MKKNHTRSFRFTDEVLSILESQKGKNLSEKFDNLVHTAYEQIPLAEKRLVLIEKQIEDKYALLTKVNPQVLSIESMLRDLEIAKYQIEQVRRKATQALELFDLNVTQ